MRSFVEVVFDDFIMGSGTTAYTASKWNDLLGRPDQITVHMIADQITTNGTIDVVFEHSADERNWLTKGTLINDSALTGSQTKSDSGSDSGSTPTLGFGRFAITPTTTTAVHVKLIAVGRDQALR